MLGQFFVTLEHEAPLCPGPMGWAYGIGEGTGLVIADVCDVVLDVLLEFTHRLPDLRDAPLSAEFCIAVTVHLAPSQGSPNKVARQPGTVGQNSKGGVRIGHIVRA